MIDDTIVDRLLTDESRDGSNEIGAARGWAAAASQASPFGASKNFGRR